VRGRGLNRQQSQSGSFAGTAREPVNFSQNLHRHEPIQNRNWWLTVLRQSSYYREATELENGEVIGTLLYFIQKSRIGFSWVRNPDWTSICGPTFDEGLPINRQANVLSSLIGQLPRSVSTYLCCEFGTENAGELISVFKQHGFSHSQELTYQLFPEEASVLNRMKSKARSQLKLAARNLDVLVISGTEFVEFYEKNLRQRRTHSARSLSLALKLAEAGVTNGQCRITAAKNSRDLSAEFDAAIACVWDQSRYYYWMSTSRGGSCATGESKPQKDATKILVLHAMEHAKSMNLIFDTDGGKSSGAQHLYKNILQMKRFRARDIFIRMTPTAALYESYKASLLNRSNKTL
jgi:hypothetical protein